MTYVLPQVLVFEEFTAAPAAQLHPLRAHIAGGHAFLVRYAEPAEQPLGKLGFYDWIADTSYSWPGRPAGGLVDDSFTKLWVKNAILKYFEDFIGSGSVVTKTASFNNRIRSATINFATNGSFVRDASLNDRDVKPGDIAKVRGVTPGGQSLTLWTYVQQLIGDPVAAIVGAASSDTDNQATQIASSSIALIAGNLNCVSATASITTYDGLPSGDVNETYDLLVIQGSVQGDFTTATVRVISGSGTDDQTSIKPSAVGVPTPIGTRGLKVTWHEDHMVACSQSATEDGVSPIDLLPGQRWRVTIHEAFTAPVATSGGVFTGLTNETYIVTVTTGGFYTDAVQPQISVTTTNGLDLSGPVTVTGAATAVAVGTHGVTVKFSGLGLRKGDRYYITATAAATGPLRTIVLGHNIDPTILAGSEVDLTLFILQPVLQIVQDRTGFAPLTNWDQTATQLTVHSGILAYDPTWTLGGVPEPLPLESEATMGYGVLYAEYRAWQATLCAEVGTISDVGDIDILIPGALDPDNPLKWGVFKALSNSNGTDVKFTAVCDPDDVTSWAAVLSLLLGRDDVYNLVPLTHDAIVLGLYSAHINAMSTPDQALWRSAWFSLVDVPEIPVVAVSSTVINHTLPTTTDGKVCLATVEDDPNTTGTQYTIVRCTSGNGAFLKNGVRPTDIVRILYTGDGFGNFTFSEFVVDAVLSEDEVRLQSGPAAAVNVAAKIEIWRNLPADDEAAEIAKQAGALANKRIKAVWPDMIEGDGTSEDGMFAAAALAGECSGILPHQGMTHLAISGFTGVSRTIGKFNRSQLDKMAAAGVWILTQDLKTGTIFTRHALTTGDQTDLNTREEMRVRNEDSVAYRFKEWFAPFIGVTNVTPSNQVLLQVEVTNIIETLKTEQATPTLGGQIIDATIKSFGPDLVFLDRYSLTLSVRGPFAFNVFSVVLLF